VEELGSILDKKQHKPKKTKKKSWGGKKREKSEPGKWGTLTLSKRQGNVGELGEEKKGQIKKKKKVRQKEERGWNGRVTRARRSFELNNVSGEERWRGGGGCTSSEMQGQERV